VAIQLKGRLKTLPPKQLSIVQSVVKSAGSDLLSIRVSDDLSFIDSWTEFDGLFNELEGETISDLQISFTSSLRVDIQDELINLRGRIDSFQPNDDILMIIFIFRTALSTLLLNALHLLFKIDFFKDEMADQFESLTIHFVKSLLGSFKVLSKKFISLKFDDETVDMLIEDDLAEANNLFLDSSHALLPFLRAISFKRSQKVQ
jgi:hypothetical protein